MSNHHEQLHGPDAEAERLLAEADACWRRGGAAGAAEALARCDLALRQASGASAERRARVWLKRGQISESGRTMEKLTDARRSHEAGIAVLEKAASFPSGDHGVYSARPDRERLRAALWMNRGNALLAMERAEEAREASQSYAHALVILENEAAVGEQGGLGDTDERVGVAAMIGAAWLNRAAAARLGWDGADGHREQGRCLRHAIDRLSVAARQGHGAARRNLAGAWLNLGAWHEAAGERDAALDSWRESARVAAPEARRDSLALEAALRARHAFCVAQGKCHADGRALGAAERAELFAQVEEGLSDHAAWRGGARAADPIATRLFEFGAWWFQRAAPERLAEFLSGNVGADDGARLEAARVAAEFARQELLLGGFDELTGERGEERRRRLRELGALIEVFAKRREACGQERGGR